LGVGRLPSVVSGDGYLGAKNSVIPQRQWAGRVSRKKKKPFWGSKKTQALPSSFFPIILSLLNILLDISQIKCYPYMCYENNK